MHAFALAILLKALPAPSLSLPGDVYVTARATVQADARAYLDDAYKQSDTFLVRRARPYLEGGVGEVVEFRVMPELAGGQATLLDGFVNLRPFSWLQIRAGKFKAPLSLERLQYDAHAAFNERSLVSDLAPDRDVGIDLHGDAGDKTLEWDLAVLDGAADGQSADLDNNFGKDFAARLFAHPLRRLGRAAGARFGIGFAASYGRQAGSAASTGLGNLKTPGQLAFFSWRVDPALVQTARASGARYRFDPQLYYYYGPIALLAEYVYSASGVTSGARTATIAHQAWNVAVSVLVTRGDEARFDGVEPKRPFSVRRRQAGAFELAARVHGLHASPASFPGFADPAVSASRALAFGLELNWYLNRAARANVSYEHTAFDGGAPRSSDRRPEDVLIGRLQIAF